MKPNYFLLTAFFISLQFTTKAQYYYRDILSLQESASEQKSYKQAGISKIKLISIEDDGSETKDFDCTKKISKDFKKNTILSKTGISAESEMITFYNESGAIHKTIDSSEINVSTNLYNYNEKGQLISTSYFAKSSDDDFINELHEQHLYQYDERGFILTMFKITNNKDTTRFTFKYDDSGNLAIEKDNRSGKIVYYYYDDHKRLTDIVHTYTNTQKMIMDYRFEYDEQGHIISMTSTEEGNGNYIVWHYFYEQDLKTEDVLYSKDGKLLGVIKYQYEK